MFISMDGVATDPAKVQAVLSWPIPVNVKQLKGFLGLTGYYRKFIKHYGMMARPLIDFLKKGCQFQWTPQTDKAFQMLKQSLVQAPVLAVPNFDLPFVLETDASDYGIGAVLMQSDHPVAYMSKHLCPRNQTLSVYEKECLAILMAMEKWRPYLQHRPFVIRTDHRSLLHLTEQRLMSKIQYKKGITNAAADALSRCASNEVLAVSECVPSWLQKLTESYSEYPEDKELLKELAVNTNNEKGYSLQDGVIKYKGRIWVGHNVLAQQHILQALHASCRG